MADVHGHVTLKNVITVLHCSVYIINHISPNEHSLESHFWERTFCKTVTFGPALIQDQDFKRGNTGNVVRLCVRVVLEILQNFVKFKESTVYLFKTHFSNAYRCQLWTPQCTLVMTRIPVPYNGVCRWLFMIRRGISTSAIFVSKGIDGFNVLMKTAHIFFHEVCPYL